MLESDSNVLGLTGLVFFKEFFDAHLNFLVALTPNPESMADGFSILVPPYRQYLPLSNGPPNTQSEPRIRVGYPIRQWEGLMGGLKTFDNALIRSKYTHKNLFLQHN
jgi:hypothetical protein